MYGYCNSHMATVTLRFNSLSEEGAIDPKEAEEEGCASKTAKDLDESYYTGATGASKLHIT